MNRLIFFITSHSKLSLFIGFIIVLIFYGEDNFMGAVVQLPAMFYFLYFLYLIAKWLFGFNSIGEEKSNDGLFPTSGTQGKIGKMRRGIRRARRMKRK